MSHDVGLRRDRPRRHRRGRPRRGDRLLPRHLRDAQRARGDQRASRASARRCSPSGRPPRAVRPAARPAARRTRRSRSSSTATGPGCSRSLHGRPTSTRPARRCASGACGCSTRPRAGHRRQPGQLRAPEGRRRRPGRAGRTGSLKRGDTRLPVLMDTSTHRPMRVFTAASNPGYRSVASGLTAARGRTNGRSPCRTFSRRSWRRRAPLSRSGNSPASPACRCRRATGAWSSAPRTPGCSTAWPPGTGTRARRCTCRRCPPPNSARVRR